MTTIQVLPKNDVIIRTVATWIYNEFLVKNPLASVKRMSGILTERAGSTQIPMTLVAFNDQGNPIGSVNITPEDMKSRKDLGPWLSGLFVVPNERGKGLGIALCKGVEKELGRLGIERAYLYTKDQQQLYLRAGWTIFQNTKYNEMDVSIMELKMI